MFVLIQSGRESESVILTGILDLTRLESRSFAPSDPEYWAEFGAQPSGPITPMYHIMKMSDGTFHPSLTELNKAGPLSLESDRTKEPLPGSHYACMYTTGP
jgi:hypothetical protein